jgi:hypothetical protein
MRRNCPSSCVRCLCDTVDKQPDHRVLDFGNDSGQLSEGTFRSDAHARRLNNDEQQANFAESFSMPINKTYQLKSVSTDVTRWNLNVLSVRRTM